MILVLASENRGKVREFRRLLIHLPLKLRSLDDYPSIFLFEEKGNTYHENAIQKARYVASILNLPVFADDSGLEIEALNFEPGIKSARFASEGKDPAKNIEKVLKLLEGVPFSKRRARFKCVIALVYPDEKQDGKLNEYLFEGVMEGFIADQPRGAGGFGYDPIFFLPQLGKTVAELTDFEKDMFSHRGKAARLMADFIQKRILKI